MRPRSEPRVACGKQVATSKDARSVASWLGGCCALTLVPQAADRRIATRVIQCLKLDEEALVRRAAARAVLLEWHALVHEDLDERDARAARRVGLALLVPARLVLARARGLLRLLGLDLVQVRALRRGLPAQRRAHLLSAAACPQSAPEKFPQSTAPDMQTVLPRCSQPRR